VGLRPPRLLSLTNDNELRVSGAQWTADGKRWRRVDDPMPRVRFVPDWKVVEDPAALAGIDVRRTALLTEDIAAAPASSATATLAVDEPGRLLVHVSLRQPALLVTTEAYDRAWRARGSAGVSLKTVAVYGDYLGVVAQPGDYRLSLTFEPISMTHGIYTSLAGLILGALVGVCASWQRSPEVLRR
jgi:hypothetical protein